MIRYILNYAGNRAAKFTLVAGVAAVVHLLLAEVLLEGVPSMYVIEANCLAFVPAVVVSYLGHRHFTFKREGSLLRFALLAATGFALNNLVLLVVSQVGVPASLAIVLSACASPVLMYLGCNKMVFIRISSAK